MPGGRNPSSLNGGINVQSPWRSTGPSLLAERSQALYWMSRVGPRARGEVELELLVRREPDERPVVNEPAAWQKLEPGSTMRRLPPKSVCIFRLYGLLSTEVRHIVVDLARIDREKTATVGSRTCLWSIGFNTRRLPWSIFAACRPGTVRRSWTWWTNSFNTSPTCPLAIESHCGPIPWRPGSSEWGLPSFLRPRTCG